MEKMASGISSWIILTSMGITVIHEMKVRRVMECKYKKLLNKADAECSVPRCDLCWYKEKYEDLAIEAMIETKENKE